MGVRCLDLSEKICDHEERSLFELFDDPTSRNYLRTFPRFKDINGLQIALTIRFEDINDHVRLRIPKCLDTVYDLSCDPSDGEFFENSHVGECRKDWYQTGPMHGPLLLLLLSDAPPLNPNAPCTLPIGDNCINVDYPYWEIKIAFPAFPTMTLLKKRMYGCIIYGKMVIIQNIFGDKLP